MSNPKAGLIDIKISGELHQLRFSLGAIEEIEDYFGADKAGKTIAQVFADSGNWSARDISMIFFAGLRRGSLPDATREEIADMLLFSEFPYYAEVLSEAFAAANTGKKDVPERPTQGAKAPAMTSTLASTSMS